MEERLLERQYDRAIQAREKHQEYYHKWMTYYYVANGAILVAITAIYSKDNGETIIPLLTLLGVIICVFWNLSCKGYYYWSISWINIIIGLERRLIEDKNEIGLFSVFSEEIANEKNHICNPIKPTNISTPKITMLFSFTAILAWLGLFLIQVKKVLLEEFNLCCSVIILSIIVSILASFYYVILPKFLKSRHENIHTLIIRYEYNEEQQE